MFGLAARVICRLGLRATGGRLAGSGFIDERFFFGASFFTLFVYFAFVQDACMTQENTNLIDLRSDTITKPTLAMREAMARAEVGLLSASAFPRASEPPLVPPWRAPRVSSKAFGDFERCSVAECGKRGLLRLARCSPCATIVPDWPRITPTLKRSPSDWQVWRDWKQIPPKWKPTWCESESGPSRPKTWLND